MGAPPSPSAAARALGQLRPRQRALVQALGPRLARLGVSDWTACLDAVREQHLEADGAGVVLGCASTREAVAIGARRGDHAAVVSVPTGPGAAFAAIAEALSLLEQALAWPAGIGAPPPVRSGASIDWSGPFPALVRGWRRALGEAIAPGVERTLMLVRREVVLWDHRGGVRRTVRHTTSLAVTERGPTTPAASRAIAFRSPRPRALRLARLPRLDRPASPDRSRGLVVLGPRATGRLLLHLFAQPPDGLAAPVLALRELERAAVLPEFEPSQRGGPALRLSHHLEPGSVLPAAHPTECALAPGTFRLDVRGARGARGAGTLWLDDLFDDAYFKRFYEAPESRIHERHEVAHRAEGVARMVEWLSGDIRSVLDVGAGAGHWRDWFARHRKSAVLRSIDASPYACRRYGHVRRDIARWRAKRTFDLVLCVSVLPYLPDDEAEAAIENLAAMAGGFLFLEVTTKKDARTICDRERTDPCLHPEERRVVSEAAGKAFHHACLRAMAAPRGGGEPGGAGARPVTRILDDNRVAARSDRRTSRLTG